MPTILIHNAQVVTVNASNSVLDAGDIYIDGNAIVAVRPAAPADALPEADRVIDATGLVAIPGFVQSHVHLCQVLFRGRSDDMELLGWLRSRTWPLEAAHDRDSVYCSAMLGICEMLRAGVTSIIDMQTVRHASAGFRAIADAGIRAVTGKVMMDLGDGVPPELTESTERSIRSSVRLADQWDGAAGGRIRYAFTPRFAVSCSDQLLREVGRIARERGAIVHTHCAENRDEVKIVMAGRGARNAVYLDRVGLLGPTTILAHCVHLDKEEIGLLAATGTHVAHCPSANLKLASGVADVPRLMARGINVGLGSDGAGCNNNLDPFIEMRLAALVQKPRHGPTSMPAATVLRMATMGGARAMGQDHLIGSIEEGKLADIVLLDLNKPHAGPGRGVDPASRIVYSAKSSDVVLTMVNGEVLYEGGRISRIDEQQVMAEAERAVQRIARRAGLIA
ncbi:MAG: Melamine deaminase [Firmicutes bacterium ADurb.Bin506]|jgi:5-methylthioadenosine/S-adenosylhomocysteine deaminase|nr:MAG: Melamine deaminase [Firmicutes bacterium ADurb.Bin506]